MFDFSTVGSERTWLKDLLLSETESEYESSDEDEYITAMLKDHLKQKLIRDKYIDSPTVSMMGTVQSITWHVACCFRSRTHNMVIMLPGCSQIATCSPITGDR